MCEYVFLCLDNFGLSTSQVIRNFKLRELANFYPLGEYMKTLAFLVENNHI